MYRHNICIHWFCRCPWTMLFDSRLGHSLSFAGLSSWAACAARLSLGSSDSTTKSKWQWPRHRLSLWLSIMSNCPLALFWHVAAASIISNPEQGPGDSVGWGLQWKAEGTRPPCFRQVQSLVVSGMVLFADRPDDGLFLTVDQGSASWHTFLTVLSSSSSPGGSGVVSWLISSTWDEVEVTDVRLSPVSAKGAAQCGTELYYFYPQGEMALCLCRASVSNSWCSLGHSPLKSGVFMVML